MNVTLALSVHHVMLFTLALGAVTAFACLKLFSHAMDVASRKQYILIRQQQEQTLRTRSTAKTAMSARKAA